MEPLLTQLLNLPGIVVESLRETETDLMLESAGHGYSSTRSSSSNLHQNHGYWVRDLPISNRQVRLKVNRRQFKCKTCTKPFSEDLDFVDRNIPTD